MAADKHEQIRRRAYEIWESEGCPEGQALRHWQQACDELDGADKSSQELLSRDDRDDAALLQGAGESGDINHGKSGPSTKRPTSPQSFASSVPEVEITTGEAPLRQTIKKTEGP
ncbi:hypothetical protein ATY81_27860 [Rhizobium sp. R72]|uniref:DUF2934 domain-containing protein n=1 Tax=unclassified Rhizobium TaxID=2613769 RepID=UPI000B531678|nr:MULTISPECIES: DUF2934 domain-containing protein [unclassified Rhizobium]OWV96125.1 hypothetical protein ATY81_27860 [Rhizobium sp. R72]OWV96609.1 hypothetical protein ATY80_27860 [Rhizobium sp. R711]